MTCAAPLLAQLKPRDIQSCVTIQGRPVDLWISDLEVVDKHLRHEIGQDRLPMIDQHLHLSIDVHIGS